jgi:hypothetical protein
MSDIGTQIRDYLDRTTAPVGAREIIMGSTFTEERETAPPEKPAPWRWAVVAIAAAAVIVIGLLLLPGGGDDVAPIDQPDGDGAPVETTTPTEEPVAEEVAVLTQVFDRYNVGDIDGYMGLVAADAGDTVGGFLEPLTAEIFLAANSTVEYSDCAVPGPDDPRDVALGHNAVCSIVEDNDYVGPAGLGVVGYVSAIIQDGEIRLLSVVEQPADLTPERFAFGADFLEWFYDAYPDEAAALPPSPYDGAFPISVAATGFPWADAMPGVLGYVDEFVAQSDLYPIVP